ncbi:1,2-phenylacetyl-CoA epoxidase subunit PaaC [Halomarina halobia]|uniref:1,2-phenylacetyl-CoA epoxidase subunit PaaC n=1 Tax=Halomarina halobia TaxID=3033386 RepID=A0ABD6AAW4_9EURY|nr:1,2-phenylacetyl-CoA epoxidase subunit PaaC [Halomarina sp. PSR21]
MATATLPGPADLDERERAAVEALLRALADDEYVAAERYIDWQVRGPTLEADISIANIAQDELGHARLWYDLLQDFGYRERDLIWEREPDDFRHATLLELPFERGDWADFVLRSYLYDVAEYLRLEALAGSSYPRIADRVAKVRAEESYHREHAQNWLERLCDDEPGRRRVQDALDRLFPRALTLFEPTDREDDIVDLGVRTESIETLRGDWLAIVAPYLESLGLRVHDGEADLAALLPEERGRDGTHTAHWRRLYNEMTYTYEMLGRREPRRIMPDPDDE